MNHKVTMLMILDGFGNNENKLGNAIKLANTPNINKLMKNYPKAEILTSGRYVGLPNGQMGNSEVGHMNIGAGRIVYQDLTKITKSIEDGEFYNNYEFISAIENCKKNNSKLHILGLLSDGGVHSHINHLYALLDVANKMNFNDVYIHCFLDGRDTDFKSAKKYINDLKNQMYLKKVGTIATISGRFYSMDRDERWDRLQKSYNALVNGEGVIEEDALLAIEKSYKKGIYDEFIEPTIINNSNKKMVTIDENDSIIFFNFRKDRARQITRALVDSNFDKFKTKKMNLYFVCFTNYDDDMPNVHVAFKDDLLKNTFGEIISSMGLTQLRIAETEKYAHVTFFFNGGEERQYENEDRILIPSPKVTTYDLKPEMSAYEVTDKVCQALVSNKYDTIILNYANPDMVGHTGNLKATIRAIEVIDECIGKVVKIIEHQKGNLLITADHGNAEQMINYETHEPNTAHTTNSVPIILITEDHKYRLKNGKLADIAPTMLDLMNIKKPYEMTGESLLIKNI